MDVDTFIERHQHAWARLDELTRRARAGVGRLAPGELDELVGLYQRVATHLSHARTYYGDPALAARLTELTARAHALVYGTRARTLRSAARFLTDTFPAAVWGLRWLVLVSAAAFLLPGVAMGVWVSTSPAALEATGPAAVREAYIEEDFAAYYSSSPAAQFASQVTTNNIQVGILAFAGGLLLAAPTLAILAFNGANVGVAAGLFGAVGEQARFWGLILPHGLLELTAVFVAGAAGLRLGWTLVDPGDRRRGEALVEEGRRAMAVVLGLVGVFALAGVIEGFVTGAPWPTWLRIGIGVTAWAGLGTAVALRGRAATAQGFTGALGEGRELGWAATPTRGRPEAPRRAGQERGSGRVRDGRWP